LRPFSLTNYLGENWVLGDAYPNPSKNKIMSIDYLSQENAAMNIQITDMIGRLILEQQASIAMGSHRLELDCTRLEIGMYIIQFNTTDASMTKKITIQ
jgi:hypothetical protein